MWLKAVLVIVERYGDLYGLNEKVTSLFNKVCKFWSVGLIIEIEKSAKKEMR